jgi:hypothetical protein
MEQLAWMRPAVEAGLKRHNRYDFLPEVRSLVKRLEENDINGTLSFARELVVHLEEKKAEDAPLGVPLDWPETTWEDVHGEESRTDKD